MQSPLGNLLFLALMFVAFYFLLIRPQRKRLEQQRSMQTSLGIGDQVVTSGGLIGTILRMDGDIVTIELSPGSEARLARRFIAGRHDEPDEIVEDVEDVDVDLDNNDEELGKR
jgi:preprotein translocase subunit YajC